MNCDEWIVRLDPLFVANLKGISNSIKKLLDKKIKRLRRNPDIGKNLGSRRPWLWEIYVGSRYRLYYEIWEKKRVVYLKAFYHKRLQSKYLKEKIIF